MRILFLSVILATIVAGLSLALEQDKRVDRKKLRKQHVDDNTVLVFKADRQTLVVPMNWKEVFFRYDRIPSQGTYAASLLFGFARLYDLDTLRLVNDSTLFQFGQARFADFFREFRPLSLERLFNSSPFDTVRPNRMGVVTHFPDMSAHWLFYFSDTSRQKAIEALSQIPGVIDPHRPDRDIPIEMHQ
jgi:hypothetical protein